MLIHNEKELFVQGNPLRNVNNIKEIDIDEVCDYTEKIAKQLKEYRVVNVKGKPHFKIDNQFNVIYKTDKGEIRQSNITQTAFSQLCKYLGLPVKYVLKCFEYGKEDLALANFKTWSNDFETNIVFKEFDGVIRGVVSETYQSFSNRRTVQTLKQTVDLNKYMLIQSCVSPEKLTLRFIEREPTTVVGDKSPIWNGFMVTNNDIGGGSLKMQDFLYRQWCTNGMTMQAFSGNAIRQAHKGENMSDGKIAMFSQALRAIEELKEEKFKLIEKGSKKRLSFEEYNVLIEKTRRNLKLSEKATDNLENIIQSSYGLTEWGVANGITELAQNFTLETRLEMESFAGNQLVQNLK